MILKVGERYTNWANSDGAIWECVDIRETPEVATSYAITLRSPKGVEIVVTEADMLEEWMEV